jgi:hypothetical protein
VKLEQEGRLEEFEDVRPPRHLKIHFKVDANTKVHFSPNAQCRLTRRGIAKRERMCRMKTTGSHAVFDAKAGALCVLLNPWKSHIEKGKADAKVIPGVRIFKGDCIWLAAGKRTGEGWYQVTEMSPAKARLGGDVDEAKLKVIPA